MWNEVRTNKEAATTKETIKESEIYRDPMKREDLKKTTADRYDNTPG